MNINFLVDKENKRVIVSNEKGTMDSREYQDNIEEVLIKEDIVKELESDYLTLKSNRVSLEGRLEDTNKKIVDNAKKRKSFIWKFIIALIGIPLYICFLEYFIKIHLYQIGIIEIKTLFYSGLLGTGAVTLIGGLLAISPDQPFFEAKRLKKEKNKYKKYIEELNLQIADLVQVLTKNKAELNEIKEQKELNNIEMMSIEVQKISYREALELEKSYLMQLYQENTIMEPEKMGLKNYILGRFKKKE